MIVTAILVNSELTFIEMRLSPSPVRKLSRQYSSKLKMVDAHLLRKEDNMMRSNGFDQLMSALALKMAVEPPQEIQPEVAKTVLMDSPEPKRYVVRSQSAPQDKKFVLRVSTHVPLKLTVKVEDHSAAAYRIGSNKGIPIEETSFKELHIEVTLQKPTVFSSTIKLLLDIINADFQAKRKTTITLKPNINEQLDAYLKEYRGRSGEILRERAIERMRVQTTRRASTGGLKKSASCQLVKQKSQLQHFQRHKSFFIKHFRKMSPQRLRALEKNEQKYRDTKRDHIGKLSMLVKAIKFSLLVRYGSIKLHRQKMRQVKITMLCKDFIKIVKNKFKLKMTHQARMRMVLHHTLHFIPKTTLRDTSIIKARKILRQFMTPYMDYRMIEELGANSQDYIRGVTTLQKFLRFKEESYLNRIIFLIDKLCYLNHIALTDKQKLTIAKQYLKICKSDSVWIIKIYTKRSQLMDLIKQQAD